MSRDITNRLGSAGATKTPMDCCVSICPGAWTSAHSPKPTSTQSPNNSTNDLDKPSCSRHHHKHSPRCCVDRLNSHPPDDRALPPTHDHPPPRVLMHDQRRSD